MTISKSGIYEIKKSYLSEKQSTMKKIFLLTLITSCLVACGDDKKEDEESKVDTCECSTFYADPNSPLEDASDDCNSWRKELMKDFANPEGIVDMEALDNEIKKIAESCD